MWDQLYENPNGSVNLASMNKIADFMADPNYSERILIGSDYVGSANKEDCVWINELRKMSRIGSMVAYKNPEAFNNIFLGQNFARMFGLEIPHDKYESISSIPTGDFFDYIGSNPWDSAD